VLDFENFSSKTTQLKWVWLSWDRCYDFKNIFAEKFCEKMAFFTQSKDK
jgi:hypothetical protein